MRQLNRATLARQLLLARSPTTLLEVTHHLVGLQAQIARPPFIGLWSRLVGLRREDVVTALFDKRLVRGTALRGTLHLMTATDFTAFRATLQAALDRGVKMLGDRAAGIEMDPLLASARTFFREPRTFDAFREHLAERFPELDVRAMAHAVRMQVPLLQFPTAAPWGFPTQAAFVTAESWLGKSEHDAGAAGLEALVVRYLAAYGPAKPADVEAWSGVSGLRPVFDALRPRLLAFRLERGGELFDLPGAPRPSPDVEAPVRLLPEWDNAIVGRADARLLSPDHRSAVFQPGLRVLATVLVDGVVAGTWKIEPLRKSVSLTVALFERQPARIKREIEAEAQLLLHFTDPETDSRQVNFA